MPKKRRIYDAVYGYIELEEVEFKLVTSPIFQRLHRIKQLGPLHTVFPSAQHSRFSHTIGVFYIVKKMIEHLEKREDKYKYRFDEKKREKQLLKFAALLHDIGHLPLSHVGEEVLKYTAEEKLQEKFLTETEDGTFDLGVEPSWWALFPEKEYSGGSTKLHERLSAEIVLHSREIDELLSLVWRTKKARSKAKKRIAQIIVGLNYMDVPTLLLHSELDADRLDYLLRDSFFTGVGYGKIDLDYIISRLVIFRDEKNVAYVCVENKGLHTVEHYILGRFFLQTQVIFNRKVRFMDLLFRDVMRYMVEHENEKWHLMNLEQLRNRICHTKGNMREDLHKIYSYTDAQVFSKMRKLHEELDKREKDNKAKDEESYINDCIKTIMDGQIDEPIESCQKVFDLAKEMGKKRILEDKVNNIARKVAKKLNIYEKRIVRNIVDQEVMKYNKRMNPKGKEQDESNNEAVRIKFEKDGLDKRSFAAKSNATILGNLADKALFILNIYYLQPKKDSSAAVDTIRKAIKQAYSRFVSKEFKS